MALKDHHKSYIGQFKKDQDGEKVPAGMGQYFSKGALREGYIDENLCFNGWGRAINKEDGSVEIGIFKNSVMDSGRKYFSDGTSIWVGQGEEESSD